MEKAPRCWILKEARGGTTKGVGEQKERAWYMGHKLSQLHNLGRFADPQEPLGSVNS